MSLIFPTKILDQHLVVLGKTGAGKSSALRHIVEHLLEHGKRVCVVDPKGDWWGLKFSADGKEQGFPVIGFGDFKEARASDVPINDTSGKHVAELITSGNRPCVIGFRGWMTSHMVRFWIDFAAGIFNANSGELYLVGDEFHNFAPKGASFRQDPEAGKCLHWSNRLLSEGRGLGIVCLIASQRPQKVHNDTLTSCETLCAMRVIHKSDRDAVKDWIEGCGDMAQGKEVLDSLAGMARGDAFVWSPEIDFGPKRLSFPMFKTFDSFAPPQLQKKVVTNTWANVDLEAVKTKLAKVIEERKANDPTELKRTIADLKRKLDQAEKSKPEAQPSKPVEVPILDDASQTLLSKVEEACNVVVEETKKRAEMFSELRSAVGALSSAIGFRMTQAESARRMPTVRPPSPRPMRRMQPATRHHPENGTIDISTPQQRILDALAWYESIGNNEPSTVQVGAVALMDATGGYFSNTVGPLSSAGLVVRETGSMRLTDLGRKHANVPDQISTLEDYHDVLRDRVRKSRTANGKTVEILNVLIEARGPLTTDQIGEIVNVDHTGGYFSNSIGPLSTLGLIRRNRGMVEPTEVMFPPGL